MTSGSRSNRLPVATLDVLAAALRRIAALAELLALTSTNDGNDTLNPEVVRETAAIIAEEAARMRTVLDAVSASAARTR